MTGRGSPATGIFGRVFHANLTTLVAGIFGIGAGLLALWLSYVRRKTKGA